MATPNVGILTNAGKNLIDQVNAGQTKITFSKIVFSSMNNNQLTDDQIKALTTVAPQEIVVNNPEVTLDNNTGETRIRATGNNEALTDGVYVKTYAVFAKDDSGNDILYGITVSPNPNYLPEYDGVTPQAVTYSYKVNISNTSNITFTNSNDVYVSDTDLAEALQPYAKTVDVNQQLDKKVNVADMRKPASDVAGIEEVNAKQDKLTITPADDSKVAHLSGANNFDTVPTVNNNPLLLASSLPSDLARTSQQTNFTAGLQSGGVDVATAADLKSIEDSAWRVLDNKYITAFDKYNTSIKVDENSLFLVKIDEVNKRVYMFFTILGNFVENSSIYIDLTSIVKNLSFPSYYLYYLDGNTVSSTAHSSIVGNRICFKIENYDTTVLNSKYSSWMVNAGDADWTYSSCFVNYDELV